MKRPESIDGLYIVGWEGRGERGERGPHTQCDVLHDEILTLHTVCSLHSVHWTTITRAQERHSELRTEVKRRNWEESKTIATELMHGEHSKTDYFFFMFPASKKGRKAVVMSCDKSFPVLWCVFLVVDRQSWHCVGGGKRERQPPPTLSSSPLSR